MTKFKILVILFGLSTCSCSPEFEECNTLISTCSNSPNADYCLFGYKWGNNPNFQTSGAEAFGPKTSGGVITYTFITDKRDVSNHRTDNVQSVKFDSKGEFAREKVKLALQEYERHANLSFQEEEDNSNSQLKFIAAKDLNNIVTGMPNFQDELCSQIRGQVLWTDSEVNDWDRFYTSCLHEIGHALGLGHVNSDNVMRPGLKVSYKELQEGDIRGIKEIYGDK